MTRFLGQRVWLISIFMLALILSVPTFVVFGAWAIPKTDVWSHLIDTVLSDYIINTLLLASGVALLSGIMGTVSAWFISQYHFPGRQQLRWILLATGFPLHYGIHLHGDFRIFRSYSDFYSRYDRYGLWRAGSPPCSHFPVLFLCFLLFPYVYGLALVAFQSVAKPSGNEQITRSK